MMSDYPLHPGYGCRYIDRDSGHTCVAVGMATFGQKPLNWVGSCKSPQRLPLAETVGAGADAMLIGGCVFVANHTTSTV